jgi:hypothetical protein
MTERTGLYAEKYLAIHNNVIGKHPRYRPDMKFTQVHALGGLTIHTRDKILTFDDSQVFEEIGRRVAQTYKLIIP